MAHRGLSPPFTKRPWACGSVNPGAVGLTLLHGPQRTRLRLGWPRHSQGERLDFSKSVLNFVVILGSRKSCGDSTGSPHSASPRHGSPAEARSGTRCCRRASQASPGRPSSSCGCGRCPFPPTSAVRAGVHSQTPHATPALRRKPTAAPRDLPGSAPRPVCPRPLEGPRLRSARRSLSVGRALQPAHALDRSSLGPSFGITHSGPARCWALTPFRDHRRGAPFREHP